MALSDRTLTFYRENFASFTGWRPEGFLCPITLVDTPTEGLCNGHLLNRKIRKATRRTVPQRADVDSFFGARVEADLVNFLNMPVEPVRELIRRSNTLTISLPSGGQTEAFYASRSAELRFPIGEIVDDNDEVIDTRFLRDKDLEPGRHEGAVIGWETSVREHALVIALIKSAYLAIFRLVGYAYALDEMGSQVRKLLATFYESGGSPESVEPFSTFRRAAIVSLGGFLETLGDTITQSTLLGHFAGGAYPEGSVFGVSCIFRANARTILITIPACMGHRNANRAMVHYSALLSDRTTEHATHVLRVTNNQIEIEQTPISMDYVCRA